MSTDLRNLAADLFGRDYFAPKQASAIDAILLEKQASTDPELIAVAAALDPNNVLSTYEKLGGTYKTAISKELVHRVAHEAGKKVVRDGGAFGDPRSTVKAVARATRHLAEGAAQGGTQGAKHNSLAQGLMRGLKGISPVGKD